MNNKKISILSALVFPLLVSCTAVTVTPVEQRHGIQHVCIQENPDVKVEDFISVLEQGFEKHFISTELYRGIKPRHCDFHLSYTAFRKWDLGTYLSHAELRLYKGSQKIGYAEYHLRGGGGFSLLKWMGTKSKMMPVIDELLAQYE